MEANRRDMEPGAAPGSSFDLDQLTALIVSYCFHKAFNTKRKAAPLPQLVAMPVLATPPAHAEHRPCHAMME
jgi:hypothetical protein